MFGFGSLYTRTKREKCYLPKTRLGARRVASCLNMRLNLKTLIFFPCTAVHLLRLPSIGGLDRWFRGSDPFHLSKPHKSKRLLCSFQQFHPLQHPVHRFIFPCPLLCSFQSSQRPCRRPARGRQFRLARSPALESEVEAKGVDSVACVSVNDPYTMAAWAKQARGPAAPRPRGPANWMDAVTRRGRQCYGDKLNAENKYPSISKILK